MERLTETWLRENGFKWSQIERQPSKHWLLWLGDALADPAAPTRRAFGSYDDLGIEVAAYHQDWNVWLRSDTAGIYHRFLHLRYIRHVEDLIQIIEALTGQKWDPGNNWYGAMNTPEHGARLRAEHERLDRRLIRKGHPWYEQEKDPTRARPLAEHLDQAIKTGFAT